MPDDYHPMEEQGYDERNQGRVIPLTSGRGKGSSNLVIQFIRIKLYTLVNKLLHIA